MAYKKINLEAGVEMRVDIAGKLILVDSVSTGQGVDIAPLLNGTATVYIPGRQPGFRSVGEFDGVLLKSALACTVGIFLSMNDVQLGGTAGGNVAVPAGVSVTNDLAHSIPVTLTSSSNITPIPVALTSIRVNNVVGDPVPVALSSIKVNNTLAEPVPVTFTNPVEPIVGVVTIDNTDAEALPVKPQVGAVFENRIVNTDAQAVPVTQKAGHVFQVEQASEVDTRSYKALTVTNVAPVAVTAVAGALTAGNPARRGLRVKNVGADVVALGGAGIVFANAVVLIQPGETWNESEAPGAVWYCICDAGLVSTLNIQSIS